uniref:Uncharacterized protein n=1 Tax=Xiphophorus couchianus TaxID=32473 RepID=A0A3B5MR47_9TELE
IMWSNFFVQQEEEGRGQRRTNKMSDSQEGKIKLVFFVAIVGVTLTVLGMGTEFWVELAQPKNYSGNQTCQMAHYGLWKGCIRTLWVADIDPERTSCGPAELPGGEINGYGLSMCARNQHAPDNLLLTFLHSWPRLPVTDGCELITFVEKQLFSPSSAFSLSYQCLRASGCRPGLLMLRLSSLDQQSIFVARWTEKVMAQ